MDPSVILGVTVVSMFAAGALAQLIAKLGLFALFTRLKPGEALEHPRRKLLHDYVKAHPGATFREIVRESGIPTGTARHHLSVLRRSDLLVEKPHKSTLRFFENHGKYDASWETLVMLREEPLAILHSWLSEHPGAMQKDIVQSMVDAHRWSRGTTQHRLGRLVEAGLVTVRAQGRLKLYTAHDSPQRATTQPAWAGLDANWPNPTYV